MSLVGVNTLARVTVTAGNVQRVCDGFIVYPATAHRWWQQRCQALNRHQPTGATVGATLRALLTRRPHTLAFAPDLPVDSDPVALMEQSAHRFVDQALTGVGPNAPCRIDVMPVFRVVHVPVAAGPVLGSGRRRVYAALPVDANDRFATQRAPADVALAGVLERHLTCLWDQAHVEVLVADRQLGVARYTGDQPAPAWRAPVVTDDLPAAVDAAITTLGYAATAPTHALLGTSAVPPAFAGLVGTPFTAW